MLYEFLMRGVQEPVAQCALMAHEQRKLSATKQEEKRTPIKDDVILFLMRGVQEPVAQCALMAHEQRKLSTTKQRDKITLSPC